jgi:hypothetical protein
MRVLPRRRMAINPRVGRKDEVLLATVVSKLTKLIYKPNTSNKLSFVYKLNV